MGEFLVHLIDWEIEMTKKPQTSKDAAEKVVKNQPTEYHRTTQDRTLETREGPCR